MDDRELLELAAKAVGGKLVSESRFGCLYDIGGHRLFWDPLEDDGQALRLLVNLSLDVQFMNGYQEIWIEDYEGSIAAVKQEFGEDRSKDLRCAIVRAAAEIGRSMP